MAPPADLAERQAAPVDLAAPSDAGADLLDLLADTSWVWPQYDHHLFLNTVEGPGGAATVLRLKPPASGADPGRGPALPPDGHHRWCGLDPRARTALAVAGAALTPAPTRTPPSRKTGVT